MSGEIAKDRRRLKVLLTPSFPDSPYVQCLKKELSRLDLDVRIVEKGPLSWTRVFDSDRADVVHLHWLHPFFMSDGLLASAKNAVAFLMKVVSMKTAGVPLVWTVHNLNNHEGRHPKLDAFVSRRVAFMADAIIVHSQSARTAVIEGFGVPDPGKVLVIPHGNFLGLYPNEITRRAARTILELGSDDFVFLYLGEIKPYKGVIQMIDAFAKLGLPGTRLVIAGRIHGEGLRTEIEGRIEETANASLFPGYVPDDAIQTYLNAGDAVVLPYRRVFTSGILLLAMSFAKACVAPDLSWVRDIIDDKGAFFFGLEDDDGLQKAMARAVQSRLDIPAMGEHNRQLVESWDWEFAATQTADVYRRLS